MLGIFDHQAVFRLIGTSAGDLFRFRRGSRELHGLFLAAAMLGGTLAADPAEAQSMTDRARAAATASRTKSGDSDALQRSYLTPGIAGQPIATVDDRTRFTPTLACQRTATMLELVVQPGPTGDIGLLRVARDRDLDGRFDQVLTAPAPVSGICANGVIACQPGTWNACRSFRWDVTSAGDLALAPAEMTALAGCTCVNASCGSNLVMGNLPSVLKDLGGGVVGALTTADPRLGVAEASIDGPVIRYTGAQATACASQPNLPQTRYRADPAILQADAVTASQGNGVFQALAASPAAAGAAAQTRACTVEREVRLAEVRADDVIARTGGGTATNQTAPGTVDFLMGSPVDKSLFGGRCTLIDFRMTLDVRDPTRLRAVRLPELSADDWAQLRVDGQLVASGPQGWTGTGLPPGKCEQSRSFYAYPGLDLTKSFTAGSHEVWLRVAVADRGRALARITAELDASCRSSERLIDSCAGYAGNQACRLVDESADSVVTVRSGVVTGLRPLPQTRNLASGACTLQLTRDFFLKDRRYRCADGAAAIPAPDLSRGAYIIDRSTETMLADRTTARDGAVTTSTRPFALPDRGSVAACEPVCKTRARAANAAAAVAGVVGQRQTNPTGWITSYRACTSGNVCPTDPGEQVVSPCGCLDDFPEAAVMMQTVRLGGADLVCTGNAR